MRNLVRNAEYIFRGFFICVIIFLVITIDVFNKGYIPRGGNQTLVISRKQHMTFLIFSTINLRITDGYIRFVHEVGLVSDGELRPIPIADGVVEIVGLVFNQDIVVGRQHLVAIVLAHEIGILAGVDALQCHAAF